MNHPSQETLFPMEIDSFVEFLSSLHPFLLSHPCLSLSLSLSPLLSVSVTFLVDFPFRLFLETKKPPDGALIEC